MYNIQDLYNDLGKLLKENPEATFLPTITCGTEGYLNIFRNEPDGPVIAISIEDANYMEDYLSQAEELVQEMGLGELSERHMKYLVQLCMEETPEADLKDFIKKYATTEIKQEDTILTTNVKQISIDIAAPADWDGAGHISELLENQGIEVLGCAQEDLTDAYKLIYKDSYDEQIGCGVFPAELMNSENKNKASLTKQIDEASHSISFNNPVQNIKEPEHSF